MSPSRRAAVVLYDGHCRFCIRQVGHLIRLARRGTLEPLSFHEPGVLERFAGLTHEQCMEAMHLVTPDGRVFRGMEAVARALVTRPFLGLGAWLYYVPPLRWALDALYRRIAARRYSIAGRTECDDGACAAHVGHR